MLKNFSLFFICIWCFLLCPDVSMALTPLKDKELEKLIATQGLSLGVDNVKLYLFSDYLIYHDGDGEDYTSFDRMAGKTYGGEIIFDNISLSNFRVDTIGPQKTIGRNSYFQFLDSELITPNSFLYKPFSIDISSNLPRIFWKDKSINKSGVIIGIPTLDIFTKEFNIANIYTHSIYRPTWNDFYSLGSIQVKNLDIVPLDGFIETFPGKTNSINIALDDIKLFIGIKEFIYEDTDGLYNPVNDEFDNFYCDISPSASISHPARLIFKNIKLDVININSIIIRGDIGNKPLLYSPGNNLSPLTQNIKNFTFSNIPQSIIQQGGSPLNINFTSSLPTTTKIYNSQGISAPVAGMFITLPSIEIYCNHAILGGIAIDDPLYPQDPSDPLVINDSTSFGKIEATNVSTAIFSGYVEVSPK